MDNDTARIAVVAAANGVLVVLFQALKAKLREARDKHGAGLPERIGRWLGRCWARARGRNQRPLDR